MSTLAKLALVLIGVVAAGVAWRFWSIIPESSMTPPPTVAAGARPAAQTDPEWRSLFDGSTLARWKISDMKGGGKVHVRDGALVLESGETMTGATYARGDFPKVDYEVAWEGRRVEGDDFFCTATFPVGDTFCSFVTGGWGGSIVGLSNINYDNASANVTTNSREFERGRWYAFRIRVAGERINAWVDAERVVNLDTAGMHVDVHRACVPCKPFGLASYKTTGEVRNVRVRGLTEAEKGPPTAGESNEQ